MPAPNPLQAALASRPRPMGSPVHGIPSMPMPKLPQARPVPGAPPPRPYGAVPGLPQMTPAPGGIAAPYPGAPPPGGFGGFPGQPQINPGALHPDLQRLYMSAYSQAVQVQQAARAHATRR